MFGGWTDNRRAHGERTSVRVRGAHTRARERRPFVKRRRDDRARARRGRESKTIERKRGARDTVASRSVVSFRTYGEYTYVESRNKRWGERERKREGSFAFPSRARGATTTAAAAAVFR